MRKKTSAAWRHFVIVNDGKNAQCKYCRRTVVIANGSTGNMFRHIKLRHPSLSIEKHVKHNPSLVPNIIKSATVRTFNEKCSGEVVLSTDVEILHTNATDIPKCSSPSKTVSNPTALQKFSYPSENVTNSEVLPNFSIVSENNQQPMSFYLVQAFEGNRRQELDKQLLTVIVKNLIPFNTIENQEFIKLVNMLNPSYILPSRKTLSNYVLDCMYQSTVNELKCTLKDIHACTLTADCWTSVSNEHFIAFTIHYLNENLEFKSNFLQCFFSLQKFSSLDIALFIEELASNWDLCSKILAIITRRSEEIVKAIDNCNLNYIPCFSQILNEIVEAGLAEINPFILKVRNVVQYFKRNSMMLSKFFIIQKEMGLSDSKLVKDFPSKWYTTFDMFTNFLKNKVPLLSTIEQLQLNFFELSSADFHYLESIIKILVIFNSIKIAMCSEFFFSFSKVLYMINFMSKQLQKVLEDTKLPPDIVTMGNTMKARMKQFEELERDELVCQAVLLDPRFKKRGLPNDLSHEACTVLRQNVTRARQEMRKENSVLPISSETQQSKVDSESEYFIDMWIEFESKEPSPVQSHTAAASVEVDAFLNDHYLSVEDNPLSYWANISNQNKFPALFELAKRMLCIPATSVPCQQIYSKAGHNFQKKRKYLPSAKVDKILFLHHNL